MKNWIINYPSNNEKKVVGGRLVVQSSTERIVDPKGKILILIYSSGVKHTGI